MPKKLAIFTMVLFFAFSPLLMLLIFDTKTVFADDIPINWENGVSTEFSFDENRGSIITVSVDEDLLGATYGDASIPENQYDRFNGEFVDEGPLDDDYRYENPDNPGGNCSHKSEIKFVGSSDLDGKTSSSGWVARFWADAISGDDGGCDSFVTAIKAPGGMGVSDHGDVSYLDKVTILVGDQGYVDINPFDGGSSSNGGFNTDNNYLSNTTGRCPASLNVIAFDDGGSNGILRSYEPFTVEFSGEEINACRLSGAVLVSIGNSDQRRITAYRAQVKAGEGEGEVYVFLPAYAFQDDVGLNDHTRTLSGSFGLSPEDDNVYTLVSGDDPGGCVPTGDNTCTYVEFDERRVRTVWCPSGNDLLTCQSGPTDPLTFKDDGALTTVPAFYGITDDVIQGNNVLQDALDAAGAEDGEVIQSCESQNGSIGDWLFCLVIDGIDKTLSGMTNAADDLLSIESQKIFDNNDLRTTWSFFRGVATFLLLAVGLVMVISQAIGG